MAQKTELKLPKLQQEIAALSLENELVCVDEVSHRFSHFVDYFDAYGLPPKEMKPLLSTKQRGQPSSSSSSSTTSSSSASLSLLRKQEKEVKYAVCSYTVTYEQPTRLRGQPGDNYLEVVERSRVKGNSSSSNNNNSKKQKQSGTSQHYYHHKQQQQHESGQEEGVKEEGQCGGPVPRPSMIFRTEKV